MAGIFPQGTEIRKRPGGIQGLHTQTQAGHIEVYVTADDRIVEHPAHMQTGVNLAVMGSPVE